MTHLCDDNVVEIKDKVWLKVQRILAVEASSAFGTDSVVGGVISGIFDRCMHKRGVEM